MRLKRSNAAGLPASWGPEMATERMINLVLPNYYYKCWKREAGFVPVRTEGTGCASSARLLALYKYVSGYEYQVYNAPPNQVAMFFVISSPKTAM